MMLFAILFGLSMDYEVFLLSRVREEYVRTGDNATAVADGLAATARVITAAAAVMIAVFLSFVLGDSRIIKLFGLGPGERDLHRRHARADGARPVDDGAARRGQLVAPAVARPAPSRLRRRGVAPRAPSTARPGASGARRHAPLKRNRVGRRVRSPAWWNALSAHMVETAGITSAAIRRRWSRSSRSRTWR